MMKLIIIKEKTRWKNNRKMTFRGERKDFAEHQDNALLLEIIIVRIDYPKNFL